MGVRVFVGFFFLFLPSLTSRTLGFFRLQILHSTIRKQFLFPFPGLTQLSLPTTFATLHGNRRECQEVKPHAELFGESGVGPPVWFGTKCEERNYCPAKVVYLLPTHGDLTHPPCSTCGGFFISCVTMAMLDTSTAII